MKHSGIGSLFIIGFAAILFSCNPASERKISVKTDSTIYTTDTVAVKMAEKSVTPDSNFNSLVTCNAFGDIKITDTYEQLELKVGKQNLREDSSFEKGEFDGMRTIIWKGTPKEIIINWFELQPHQRISEIKAVSKNSPYHLTNGIKIGSTLAELTKQLGRPIIFRGFNLEYGGSLQEITDMPNGYKYHCFSCTLETDIKIADKFYTKREIRSDEKELLATQILVSSINILGTEVDGE